MRSLATEKGGYEGYRKGIAMVRESVWLRKEYQSVTEMSNMSILVKMYGGQLENGLLISKQTCD